MSEQNVISHVALLVDQCEDYLSEQSSGRDRALEYYSGKMSDMPADEGRSSVVSKDVRSIIKKLMPSVMRSILSNDKIVDYEPVGQQDEDAAQQATDYINHVVVPECGAEKAIHDAVADALLLKTGILKWSAYTRRKSVVHDYTNVGEDDILGLFDDEANQIDDFEEAEETDPQVLALNPDARRFSFKLRRIEEDVSVRLEAVPRGAFLIAPNAEGIEDAPIVGERLEMTRSDLVSMGYDKEQVFAIATHSAQEGDEDKQSRMGVDWTDVQSEATKALEPLIVYEVYVKLDQDGDGIAEMYRIVFGEAGTDGQGKTKHVVLDEEQVAEAPYAEVVAERDAHQFEGHSVFEDLDDIQRIKTALLRGSLDNVYGHNNPQPAVDLSQVLDPDAIYNPEFGKPIALKQGADAARAIQWSHTPFVADKSFSVMGYFDEVAKDRTGITDASGGVDPEAFQQMTATSAQLMSEAGIAQADMIIRSLTRGGVRKAFRGLLKLVIAHHDQPRTVRMRGEWVDYDPRHWNVDMDCTVNVGLGAGSRERDMSVLQIVLGLQREIISSVGADNPFVKPEQLYNTLEKITETAGFPSAEPYFTRPDPQEIAARMQAQQSQPDPEAQKVQMQMQLEQAKANARQQVEAAQMQADLQVKEAEREKDLEIASLKAQVDLLKHSQSMELEYAKAGMAAPSLQQIEVPNAVK